MIVVVGSRHDSVARSLVEALPSAALCAAEDLTRPGWLWPLRSHEPRSWVVNEKIVDDREVTGIFVRRTYVYPEELLGTHPDDREYLAAESISFLVFVLSQTGARVVNPVAGGALGEEGIRHEKWMRAATDLGMKVFPLRLTRAGAVEALTATRIAEVVGSEVFGDAPPRLRTKVRKLAEALGLVYAAFLFDTESRLVTVCSRRPPSEAAIAALSSLLSTRRLD